MNVNTRLLEKATFEFSCSSMKGRTVRKGLS